jgi:hypothetical protein
MQLERIAANKKRESNKSPYVEHFRVFCLCTRGFDQLNSFCERKNEVKMQLIPNFIDPDN